MMETNSSRDESSDDEMLEIVQQAVMTSSIWIWNMMQVCTMEMNEVKNDKPRTGRDWIPDILNGHHTHWYESFRISLKNFMISCD